MATPLLSLDGASKSYGAVVALGEINLDIEAGECVGLIGPNGAGKTTAVRLAAGYLQPTSGSVKVGGVDIHKSPDAHEARRRLAFVPDHPTLYDDMSIFEHLEFIGLAHGVGEDLDAHADFLLKDLGLEGRRDFLPSQLSKGTKQKVQIACALIRPFDILVLDEPLSGLDPPSREVFRSILEHAKAGGAAILLTIHQVEFLVGLADRAVILSDGEIAAEGSVAGVLQSKAAVELGLR